MKASNIFFIVVGLFLNFQSVRVLGNDLNVKTFFAVLPVCIIANALILSNIKLNKRKV